MSNTFKSIVHALCALGIALNTALFGINLFNDAHYLAIFNLLWATGCWVGYFKYKGIKNGNE
jgi:hypothetical protein